jgi:hypothetical protein
MSIESPVVMNNVWKKSSIHFINIKSTQILAEWNALFLKVKMLAQLNSIRLCNIIVRLCNIIVKMSKAKLHFGLSIGKWMDYATR